MTDQPNDLIAELKKNSGLIYLATESPVADQLSILFLAAATEIKRCHAKLEIDYVWVSDPNGKKALDYVKQTVPYHERANLVDGIEARDTIIHFLEEERRNQS